MVDVWELVRGSIAFRALTAGEAEAPPRAHPRAFRIDVLACCMTPGEMSSYDKDDRKEHNFSVSVAMGDEKMKFEVGLNIFKGVADRRGVAVPGSSGGVVSYPAAIQPPDSRNKRASAVYNRAQ